MYTDWCITKSKFDYDTYTQNKQTFYFCTTDGFESIPKEQGNNTPLDKYGLSMIAVSVYSNGRLASCTTRWNEARIGNKTLNIQQISELVGQNFYNAFIPKK